MLKKARTGAYSSDTPKKIKADMELLWRNIQIFNMPNTPEYLEGSKFNILASYAFTYFQDILSLHSDDYLFDEQEIYLVKRFYDFKKSLIRSYLNLISNDYVLNEDTVVQAFLEEKDNRSLSSKERNKLSHLLSIKKMKNIDLEELYEYDRFVFDLDSKSLVVSITGINMLKLDYNEVDLPSSSHSLKNFIRQHTPNLKKSTSKHNLENLAPQSIDQFQLERLEDEKEDDRLTTSYSLAPQDFQLICQLEYWFHEHKNTLDHLYLITEDMQPISIKTSDVETVGNPVCLVSGYDMINTKGSYAIYVILKTTVYWSVECVTSSSYKSTCSRKTLYQKRRDQTSYAQHAKDV